MNLGDNLTVIICAFARISAFLFMIPLLSGKMIPRMAKIVLSVGLSLAVVGRVEVSTFQSEFELIGYIIMQVIIGVTLAKIVEMLMVIPTIAGSIMDMEMGFSSVSLYDPTTKQNNTILGVMLNIMFVVSFISLGGIQSLIMTIVRSFELTETLMFLGKKEFLELVTSIFGYMLSSAVQIALPIMGAMFVVNFVMLIIGKTAPQTQILTNMFPIKIGAGILFLAITIPIMGDVFQHLSEKVIEEFIHSFNYMFKK
ncbi:MULTISPECIES: flagellar biosynthetic protein FliR [Bacillus cereus group]|uniref:flagellar biosynthetic protein FliR n=1 Tax=Bacillus cereus group TaxID=86661 RepID=UPI0022E96583|nr:flagellar biosynthetic protein FliR [Bacillus cereus group sp. TH152-1LC]MDA1674919.1 flagellar biosynthetic protein FliR [Bacillus cereus group sp. TH152-1LC]